MTQAQPEPRPRIRKVILLIETSRAFGRGLLYGIARYCRTHGPWSVYREPGGLEHSFSALTDWNADGIIARNPKKMKELASLGIPCVLVIHHPEAPSHFPRGDQWLRRRKDGCTTLSGSRLPQLRLLWV